MVRQVPVLDAVHLLQQAHPGRLDLHDDEVWLPFLKNKHGLINISYITSFEVPVIQGEFDKSDKSGLFDEDQDNGQGLGQERR